VHSADTVLNWILAVLGAGSLLYGVVGLQSRSDDRATQLRLGRFWMGVFILVETGPRLAGWPAGVVLAISVLAFVPMGLAVRRLRRT
jgi:hypothetical protein